MELDGSLKVDASKTTQNEHGSNPYNSYNPFFFIWSNGFLYGKTKLPVGGSNSLAMF